MDQRKELSEQEKVQEILNGADASYDPRKARESIALDTRCRRCGGLLSSLERIVFQDVCETCMKNETKSLRDRTVRKYLAIACAFVSALIFGGFCANSRIEGLRIAGVVISALLLGPVLGYVFYTNMDKMFPGAGEKARAWISVGFAAGIALVIAVLTYISKNWIIFVALMLLVAGYLLYLAYGELTALRERMNLISVFDRKAADEEYVESITEAMEERSRADESEREEYEAGQAADSVPDEAAAADEPGKETPDTPGGKEKKAEPPADSGEDAASFSI